MSGYLLDTDICIFFLKGKYSLIDKVAAVGIDNCFVSEITIAELLFGAENSQNHKKHIEEVAFFEENFKVIPISKVLRFYAKEKARLRKNGTPVAEFDLLIGSTAVSHDLILVTRNQKHFRKIDSLQLEDWTSNIDNEFV